MVTRRPYAAPEEQYQMKDDDTETGRTISGTELRNGLTLQLPEPRSSVLLRLKKI